MGWLEAALGIKFKVFIAGALGGVVSLRFFDNLDAKGRLIVALGGVSAAVFGQPAASAFFKLTPEYDGGLGFVIGLFAMSVAGAGVKAIPALIERFTK